MTTTNINGIIVTNDGIQHHVEGEPTDGSATAITIRDLGGTANVLGTYLKGKSIVSIKLQLSDGSFMTTLVCTQAGRETHHWKGGERLADSEDVYNLVAEPLNIPVNDQTIIKVNCAD